MKNLKILTFLFLTSLFFLSCEPDKLPENSLLGYPYEADIFSDTGEQKDIPDEKEDE